MTAKLPEIWLKYASDDLQSAEVLFKEGIYNCIKSAKIYDANAEICNCTSEEILEKNRKIPSNMLVYCDMIFKKL